VNIGAYWKSVIAASLGFAAVLGDCPVWAEPVDPSYGRLDADVTVAPGLGFEAGPRGPRLLAELRARYLHTVGVFAVYEDGPALASQADPARVLSFGAELRPVFLARYLQDLETQRAWLDLVVDSFGLEVGAVFAERAGGPVDSHPGLEVGFGVGVPVVLRACGPWLGVHAGLRWSDVALETGSLRGPEDRAFYFALTLAYEQLITTHIVDVGDRAPQ
jgi:hypothetical protein